MAPVVPLSDRVLVVVIPKDRVSAGGVVLPDSIREESDRGVVVSVGPGVAGQDGELRAPPVSPGDVVVFSPYAGSKVSVGQDDFLLLREQDLLGVLSTVEVPVEVDERYLRAAT